MSNRALDSYVSGAYRSVQGWLARLDAEIFRAVMAAQTENALTGSAVEIGVHHGRSFIALCLALTAGEKAYCIDVFERQDLNRDRSGHGDRAAFERNLARFGIAATQVTIDPRPSQEVGARDILDAVGPARFVSVDGGHWLDLVRGDLKLAEAALAEHGVIALDDFHRPDWPDVSVGYFAWWAEREKQMAPLAIGYNKLYLCDEQRVAFYRQRLLADEFLRPLFRRNVTLQGFDVPLFQYVDGGMKIEDHVLDYLKACRPEQYGHLVGAAKRAVR